MGIAHCTYTATALVVCIVMLFHYKVESSSIFQLNLISYDNPEGREISGGCCSGRQRADGSCQGNCSVYLRFCLKHYEANVDLKGNCTFKEFLTPLLTLDNSTVSFPSWEMLDSQDQFKMSFDLVFTWLGEFSLIVEAWHPADTEGSGKTLVSQFTAQRSLEVGLDWTVDKLISGHTSLDLRYRVICAAGYFGPKCKTLCRPRDDNFGHYKCGEDGTMICINGWSGSYCDKPVCASGCHNGTCSKPGECNCRFGWEGALCDQCKRYPGCVHGGCKTPWSCICDEGWGGVLCDKDLNYCTNHKPCRNGGTCTNTGQGSYTCACSEEYMGETCDTLKDPCQDNPCLNNGICENPSIGEYVCKCELGYFGPRCETSASICTEGLCKNGGSCIQDPDGFVCSCLSGFTGSLCERVDNCQDNYCLNGGTCVISGSAFVCICPFGVSGDHCEIENICYHSFCKNGGTCLKKSGTASCSCPPGFTGTHCHIQQNRCSSHICANGGTCHNRADDYYCECKPEFFGKNCTLHQNHCNPSPCLNGASCHVTANGFTCHCLHGYRGNRCHLMENKLAKDWNESPSVASNVSHRISEEKDIPSESKINVTVAITVSTIIIIIILIAMCVIICYRRQNHLCNPIDEPKRHKDCDFDLENEQAQNERNAMYMNNKHCDMPQKIVNELDRVSVKVSREAPPKVLNNEISNNRVPELMCSTRTLQQKIDNTIGNSSSCHSPPEISPYSSKPIYTIEDHLRPCSDRGLYLNMGESLGTDV